MAHHSFLAVHEPTVEKYGTKWTEPRNIVTNGAFKLAGWKHDASITLVKNAEWRNADEVGLDRVEGRIIVDGTTRVQAFEAGEVDALDGGGLPPADMPRLKQMAEYEKYPALGTYYYGFNMKNIPDVNQRRAMALAIDRQSIIDYVAQADQIPATGMVPKGMPGFDVINQDFLPSRADIGKAREFMAQGRREREDKITLVPQRLARPQGNRGRGPGDVEAARHRRHDQGAGVGAVPRVPGPPPANAVDIYRLGWIGDYVDPMNFLELWTSSPATTTRTSPTPPTTG